MFLRREGCVMSAAEEKARGRPRSFDEEVLLAKVADLFWKHGYENLSLSGIAQAVGLPRASLYNAFKSKENLFLEALQVYKSRSAHRLFATLEDSDRVRPVLYQIFADHCRVLPSQEKRQGCLVLNAISELITADTFLGEAIREMCLQETEMVIRFIERAKRQGELPLEADPTMTAHLMMSFEFGLSSFSKNGMPESQLRQMCHVFLKNLGFSREADA